MSATIQFEKNNLHEIVYFEQGDSLLKLNTFAQQLSAYSHAAITRVAITAKEVLTLPESAGEYTSIRMAAKIFFRDQDDGKLWGIMIHAPFSEMFEEVLHQGYRVKKSVGDQLAIYYSQYSGLSLTFESGWLVGGR